MNKKPAISVIIPCFNGEKYLRQAIESALKQTEIDKEIIVVNDGSTDKSASIMAEYEHATKIITQSNQGRSAARNSGIRAAQGEYLAFLDADDYWSADFLRKMLVKARQTGATVVYCGWQNVGNTHRDHPFIPPDYQQLEDKWEKLFKATRWPIHAAIVSTSRARYHGMFDERRSYCEDYDLWLRVALNEPLARVPEVLAFYRHHKSSTQMSAQRSKVLQNHFDVQMQYIRRNPNNLHGYRTKELRPLTLGYLLKQGFDAYWQQDLITARSAFRTVMRYGYGSLKDWLYMLPSLLPRNWHQLLLDIKRR